MFLLESCLDLYRKVGSFLFWVNRRIFVNSSIEVILSLFINTFKNSIPDAI
jgi:hypothetical protein